MNSYNSYKRVIPSISIYCLISLFITGCTITKLIPIGGRTVKEANGIIITIGEQNISFDKNGLFTPVYIVVANNTDKKVKLDYKYFLMIDDNNNQFSLVPLEDVKKSYEKEKREQKSIDSRYPACPPYCYPYQIPYTYDNLNQPIVSGQFLYPFFSSSPYLYYKDKDGNFQVFPYAYPYFGYPYFFQSTSFDNEVLSHDPELLGMRMEEIYPHFQMQGYIYFHQATRLAKEKVTLLVNIPDFTKESILFEFKVK